MLSVADRVLPNWEAEQLRNAGFTYSEVGSTRGDTLPAGYGNLRRSLEIGVGTERFEQAAQICSAGTCIVGRASAYGRRVTTWFREQSPS
jgi:uncharacterized protein (UPF0548 family)